MASRALLIAPFSTGDAVMAQPLVALLRHENPGLCIDALCTPHAAMVFRCMTEVAEVIEGPSASAGLQLAARWRIGRALRTRGYARAYVLPEDRRSALIPWFAGIDARIGYRGEARHLLLNRIHEAGGRALPQAERYAALAFEPGRAPPGEVREPRLQRQPERERAVRIQFGFGHTAPPIVLCPGADLESYRWPARHYATLVNLLARAWPRNEVLLVGSPADRPFATEIAAMAGRSAHNLCGDTSPDEAAAIVSQAAGVLTGDSGLMHLAAAFGRPQVALFGPTDPRRSPPRSVRAHVEWEHLACSPCFEPRCPLAHHACMSRITPLAAFESLERVMRYETTGTRPIR